MRLINKILSRKEIQEKPPVLVDIGASGKIHSSWKKLANFSICIAFDADLRDFSTEITNTKYKKLILINRVVSDCDGDKKFFLTNNPHCSSVLKPELNTLSDWLYKDYFVVNKVIDIESSTLNNVLDELKIDYIDWFKTDSQGTDLRIYKKIPKNIRHKLFVAEFEPGIINAYQDEDKLYSVLKLMNDDFFIDNIKFRGSHRIKPEIAKKNFSKFESKFIRLVNNESKLHANVSYLNNFKSKNHYTKRDVLLFLAILIIKRQYLFCIEICDFYKKKFEDKIFNDIRFYCRRKVKFGVWRLIYHVPYKLALKFFKSR